MRNHKRTARPPLRIGLVLMMALVSSSCAVGTESAAPEVVVRTADEVQVVSPAEAERLLADGADRAGDATRVDAGTETTLSVTEANRSFQVRLGTALSVFNSCLGENGFVFVGIPGQTDDPRATENGYLEALIACNNESGIGNILAEQQSRQSDLTAEQKTAINESGRSVFECLIDRGWDLGELAPNENGILTVTRFPDVPPERQTEFQRDLDECGWNDLDLG
ncbi:MAG: hypothetical protein AAGD35_18780 [Actinomycetota bacterium]